MKPSTLFLAAALAFASASASAQNATSPAREEVTQASGNLKEAYGVLSKSIAMLDREVGADAKAATPAQKKEREKLTGLLAEVEAMLTAVNTADAAHWPEVKEKAEATRKRAMEAAEARIKR